MISDNAPQICRRDRLWDIENYDAAIVSPSHWHLHHKIGAYCNRRMEQLIEEGLYYDRPPNELVFLKAGEHMAIHCKCRNNPVLREELRRLEMTKCYERALDIDPWLLSEDECRNLNDEIEQFNST